MKQLTLLLLAIILTTGCKQKEDLAGFYDVVSVAGDRYAAYGVTLNIEMGAENKISGDSGCNQYFGNFENPKSNQVVMGQIAGTKMFCKEKSKIERTYLEHLSKVAQVRPVTNGLELLDNKGTVLITAIKRS